MPRARAAVTMAPARTWAETWSREAARRSSSSGSVPPSAVHVGEHRPAVGQRAGLVEQQHVPGSEPLQRRTTLDDDAGPRGAGQPRT